MVKNNNKSFASNLRTAARIAVLSKILVSLSKCLQLECLSLVPSKTNLIHKKTATIVSKLESLRLDCNDLAYTYQTQPRLVGPDIFDEIDFDDAKLQHRLDFLLDSSVNECYIRELRAFPYKQSLCDIDSDVSVKALVEADDFDSSAAEQLLSRGGDVSE